MRKFSTATVWLSFVLITAGNAVAQRGARDWTTAGYDAQRSYWLRGDLKITPETMAKPGFQLVWKTKLNNQARQLNALTPPVLLDFYIGYRGFRALGFLSGSSGNIIGIDIDLPRLEWEKNIAGGAVPAGTATCPGGITSSVTRITQTVYPSVIVPRGFGRSAAAKSGVGEPDQGAVTLKEAPARPPVFPTPPPAGTRGRNAPPPNPFAPSPQYVYAISGDGKFHALYVSNGEEPAAATPFLPPNANAQGLIVFDNTAYAATVNGCGGVENGVWALDLASKKVSHWKAPGNVAGSPGFAASPDGIIFAAAGGELASLDPTNLQPKGSYKPGQDFRSSPLVFEHKGKDLVAAVTADGRLHVLDTASLDKALAVSAPFTEGEVGALASWQDDAGTRWIVSPASGAAIASAGFSGSAKSGIVAWKLVDQGGSLSLQPGWVSRELNGPLTPAIVNGIVFAVSSGLSRGGQRGRAVLYALDGGTGKEIWNSGPAITSFVKSGGLAAGGGRVYVSGHDGTQYAFGFPMETLEPLTTKK